MALVLESSFLRRMSTRWSWWRAPCVYRGNVLFLHSVSSFLFFRNTFRWVLLALMEPHVS